MNQRLIIGSGYTSKALYKLWDKYITYSPTLTTTTMSKYERLISNGYRSNLMKPGDINSIQTHVDCANVIVIAITPKDKNRIELSHEFLSKSFLTYYTAKKYDHCKHIVVLSSTGVYGDHNGDWVDEQSECITTNVGCQSLLIAENNYLSLRSVSTNVTILRLGGIHGPEKSHRDRLINRLSSHPNMLTSSYCNYVYLDDIIDAINWVIDHKCDGVYNICSDDHPTRNELADRFINVNQTQETESASTKSVSNRGKKRVSNKKIRDTGFIFQYNCFGEKNH
jgi:NAD dependent epimerase/dehydratase family enzyme